MSVDHKTDRLLAHLRGYGSGVLALSGGLDSALLTVALGRAGIKALAVTGKSETTPPEDLADAVMVAGAAGVPHRIIESRELASPGFIANGPDRCFHCKDALFKDLGAIAAREGYAVVMDGSNLSDLSDHRPGLIAKERHGVRSPLIECEFTKDDIRQAARGLGLSLADKPSSPCLSSRFPYGVRISAEALNRVSRAEQFIKSLGFNELRVRDLGGTARIEVPASQINALFTRREEITRELLGLGYESVCIDLEGLVSGKLNRSLGGKQ